MQIKVAHIHYIIWIITIKLLYGDKVFVLVECISLIFITMKVILYIPVTSDLHLEPLFLGTLLLD